MPVALVIEDDEDERANLSDLLELDGFDVLLAATAREAREQLCSHPEVAILDRKLPDGLAEDLLPEFRQTSGTTEFVVVTGYADLQAAIAAMRNGACDYLLKPIQPETLRERLRRIVGLKSLESQFHREHEFSRKILDTAEAIVLVLDLDGRIEHFNQYLTELTGWKLEEVHFQDWFDIFVPEFERERIRDTFMQTACDVNTSGTINQIISRNGDRKDIRWSNNTLKNEDGETSAVLAIGVDITDLAESQERVLRSERLATIGQMMAAVAHESRNALQRIQASTDLLDLEIENNNQALQDVEKIRGATKDLTVLLEELRSFAAPIVLRKESVLLGDIISQAWSNIEAHRSHRDVNLEVDDALKPAQVCLDAVRFEQVFRNLFENSLAACSDPVELRVASIPGNEGHICFQVADNGPGLSQEQALKVFDAFYTTKDKGTGLGMAIVQRIVEAHDGRIEVHHSHQDGARFNFELPIHPYS
jgi:PAS domain S-box-containing protein